jgi:hypothetical protein
MAKATGGYIQQLPSGSFRACVYAGTDALTGQSSTGAASDTVRPSLTSPRAASTSACVM